MNKSDVKNRVQDWQQKASETAKNLGQTTDQYVRENTWSTLAIAAVLGCIVGFVLAGGRDD